MRQGQSPRAKIYFAMAAGDCQRYFTEQREGEEVYGCGGGSRCPLLRERPPQHTGKRREGLLSRNPLRPRFALASNHGYGLRKWCSRKYFPESWKICRFSAVGRLPGDPKSPSGVGLTESRLTSLRLSRRRFAVTSTVPRPPKMPTSSRRGLVSPTALRAAPPAGLGKRCFGQRPPS